MKFALAFIPLFSITTSLKWDKLKINPSVLGVWNPQQQYWTAGLHECDGQCGNKGGIVCGKR